MRPGMRAADFGVALARRWWTTYMPAWLLITLPIFAAGAALVYWNVAHVALIVFGLWWLKPLYDRVILFVLSRAFFGEEMSLSKTLSLTLRSWLRWPALLEITFLRLIPVRGTLDPVLELERPRFGDAFKRYGNLLGGFDIHGLVIGTMMEWAVVVSTYALVAMIMPETLEYDAGMVGEAFFDDLDRPAIATMSIAIYWIAVTMVEPFFVATGFASYINRRVELEGWDIELIFRSLAERLARRASDVLEKVAAVLIASAFALAVVGAPTTSWAQEDLWAEDEVHEYEEYEEYEEPSDGRPPADTIRAGHYDIDGEYVEGAGYYNELGEWVYVDGYFDADGYFVYHDVAEVEPEPTRPVGEEGRYLRTIDDPDAKIDQILADPEFGEKVTEEVWQLKEGGEREEPGSPPDMAWVRWLATVMKFIAYAVIAALIGGIIYLVFRFFSSAEIDRAVGEERRATSIVLPDGRKVPLSKTWLDDVMPAWNQGDRVLALSLLYRGTLAELKHVYGIKIPPSATAREATRVVREAGGPHEFVRKVGRFWTSEVYAARGPSTEEVERAVEEYRELERARGAA